MYLLVQALKIRAKKKYNFMLDIERKVAKEKVINMFTINLLSINVGLNTFGINHMNRAMLLRIQKAWLLVGWQCY
jgi:hypothetical protein